MSSPARHGWELQFKRPAADTLQVSLSGYWRLQDHLPPLDDFERALAATPGVRRVSFDAQGVAAWDTGLVSFVMKILQGCQRQGMAVDRDGLPVGVNRLIALALAVPEKKTGTTVAPPSWLARLGVRTITVADDGLAFVRFIGESTLAFGRFVRGKANFRWVDLFVVVEDCGPKALPIITLISFLVGLILAFMGAVQLRNFGAQVYVADLVAIAATREMGCLMAGIIMAGRTGAAFAAQLGTMRVNEEIDALITMGIPPMDFLVLPRMLALIAMMPLLTVYADLLAIFGGTFVGVTMLDLGAVQYLERTQEALTLTNFFLGIVKGSVFGVLVALSGCLRGMQCGRSAAAVGLATTSAVVTSIVLIVVAEGIFALVLDAIGI
ncbi:MAG: MlaE family ABC transporter permease [Candidatus Rokuibacteriota bacterium]